MSYIKTKEYLKRINDRIFESYQAYFIRKYLYFKNETEGEKQEKMTKKYKNFYSQTAKSNLIFFILWITKFFDNIKNNNKSLSIEKILNYIESNQKELTKKEFLENNFNRPYVNDLAEKYQGIIREDIKKINILIDKNKEIISQFKILRNKRIAHDDINIIGKEIKIISYDKIEGLFNDIIKITNILSYGLEFSTTDYSHIEKQIQEEITNMFKNTI